MRHVGIHLGHDASIVVLSKDGNVEFFAHTERFSPRKKMNGGTLVPIFNSFPDFKITDSDEIVFVYDKTLNKDLSFLESKEFDKRAIAVCDSFMKIDSFNYKIKYLIDHHFAHAISSWCFRNDDKKRLFLSYDGCGSSLSGKYKSSLVGHIFSNGFSIEKEDCIISSLPLFSLLGFNSAGKSMGLSGYYPEFKKIKPTNENIIKIISLSINNDFNPIRPRVKDPNSMKDIELVVGIYNLFIEEIWISIKKILDEYNPNGVVIAGGTALALEINTNIFNQIGDVFFGPATNDSGLALGAAAFSFFAKNKFWPKLKTPSLINSKEALPLIGEQDYKKIAKIIADGTIVGLLRGKSEIGPRSLGYRSILANAKSKEQLVKVSQEIKEREFYRPLAPIVTIDQFDRLFIGPKGEYMQYRAFCTEETKKFLPAIVHKDGTSRPQVVTEENDVWMYSLLKEYGKITGYECMINTSLNGKGKPICNSYSDAKEDFKNKDIKLISIPDSIKNKLKLL